MSHHTVEDADVPTYVPEGRPVRTFALVLVAIGLASIALWWSGAVAPRLTTGSGSAASFDTTSLEGDVRVSVRNAGRLPLRVRGIAVDDPRLRQRAVEVLAPDPDTEVFGEPGLRRFEPLTLGAGEAAEVRVAFRADGCAPAEPDGGGAHDGGDAGDGGDGLVDAPIRLAVDVRTSVGIGRTVHLEVLGPMNAPCLEGPPG